MKHTPGPWSIRTAYNMGEPTNLVIQSGTTAIADLCVGTVDGPDQEVADARLIAAAPELLAAVRAFLDGFADGSIKWTTPRRSDSDPYHPANVLACAAIAKVEGRD